MQKTSKQKIIYTPVVTLFIAFIAIFLIWLYWGSDLVWWTAKYWRNRLANDGPPDPTLTIAELGQIGDLFGGINSLFASLAFIGVAFAAYYQRQTYLQQLKDSEDNKKALEASNLQQLKDSENNKKALEASNETNKALLTNANHELFIGLFLRMVEELRMTSKNLFSEKELEKMEIDLLEINAQSDILPLDENKAENLKKQVADYYSKIFQAQSRTLRPFNKTLYQTFLLIQESGMSYSNQDKYAQIAITSIGDHLWIIIMMYGITSQGERLHALIEKYGLLENSSFHPRSIAVKNLAHWLYMETAFQSPEERELVYDKENAIAKMTARNREIWKANQLRIQRQAEILESIRKKYSNP